jgi:hypothetical protein
MWPLTWAEDGQLYAGAGDNRASAFNVWRIEGGAVLRPDNGTVDFIVDDWILDVVDNEPLDPAIYCTDPRVHPTLGLKAAGLLDVGGRLHLAVESHNYGSDPSFNRQTNIEGWIITSDDYGKTWNREATEQKAFFSGRVASCHFLQFGKGAATPDGWTYAYFPGASDDGNSYWCNGDYILLGRVRPESILDRAAWEFFSGTAERPSWSANADDAAPIFEYFHMTGENHVSYNAGIGRYVMGNYSFLSDKLEPMPYHQEWPGSSLRSQLTLYEAPAPWGPWSLFHRDDNWGTYGDYQPSFPGKWMFNEGRTMFVVSSGSFDDYNFTVQRVDLIVEDARVAKK